MRLPPSIVTVLSARKSRRIAILITSIAIVMIAIVLRILPNSCPDITSHAVVVGKDRQDAFLYVWITEHELLRACSGGNDLCVVDTKTGTEVGLASLTKQKARAVEIAMARADEEIGVYHQWSTWSRRRLAKPPNPLVQLPAAEYAIVEAIRSWRQDRIAWLLVSNRRPWLQRMLAIGGIRPSMPETKSLWVSRADGTFMTCIGSASVSAPKSKQDEMTGLRWVSDDSGVSFFYRGQVWQLRISR